MQFVHMAVFNITPISYYETFLSTLYKSSSSQLRTQQGNPLRREGVPIKEGTMNFQVMESHWLVQGLLNNSHSRERPVSPITSSVTPINLVCSTCQTMYRTWGTDNTIITEIYERDNKSC